MYRIILLSDQYGADYFDYATLEEAEECFDRLRESCMRKYVKDGIDRSLFLTTRDWSTEDEEGSTT